MYSGKTEELIRRLRRAQIAKQKVLIFKPKIDNRYSSNQIVSHSEQSLPSIVVDNPSEILNLSKDAQVIGIDEVQFFSDLEEFVKNLLNRGNEIYVCGLDGDFERKKFGQILDLIPLCDKVTKLTSLCSLCKNGTPGIFSKRITSEKEQTVVGSDNYIPVCRSC